MRWCRWNILLAFLAALNSALGQTVDTLTTSVNPPPVGGEPFTITWTTSTQWPEITIALDYYFSLTTTQNIIEYSTFIATNITNTGSFIWNVPLDLAKGRYSFSLRVGIASVLRTSTSGIFTYAPPADYTPTPTLSIAQTTACITPTSAATTPTGTNAFLNPANDDYTRFRAGYAGTIEWVPTTSGTVTLLCTSEKESPNDPTVTTTIASKISNSGTYSWTPDASLASNSGVFKSYYMSIVVDSDPTIMTNSTTFFVLSASTAMDFLIQPGDPPPVLGQSYDVTWSPNNATAVSLIIFGGSAPGLTVNVTIADHVANTGSFTWDVPTNQYPIQAGYWTLGIFNDDTGNRDATREFVIDAETAQTCSGYASIVQSNPTTTNGLGTASTSSRIHTTNTAFAAGVYAQDLEITSCTTSVEPRYTSIEVSQTVVSFAVVGCGSSSSSAAASNLQIGTCKSDFQLFSLSGQTSVCCPSYWSTSALVASSIYCFTTTATPSTVTLHAKRDLIRKTNSANPTVVLQNIVFAQAGIMTASSSGTSSALQTSSQTASGAIAGGSNAAHKSAAAKGVPNLEMVSLLALTSLIPLFLIT
ncbi:hypothetical protein BP6252_04699 [Coleophoma cylindrospora]|uniref:Yeast cell wall synthesis Kre9/Knh1-like N-terminal domain-containing protein n=1 Tax=Coleophoma cylindrospora TaxID=1849047 RepID=A0A3D8S1T7_9HELO|nr:hypothetical protein BP6252_04699 [Coleophoma cylindrospora]